MDIVGHVRVRVVYYVFIWQILFLPTYFTIQFIFYTIHVSHCTFWYYS